MVALNLNVRFLQVHLFGFLDYSVPTVVELIAVRLTKSRVLEFILSTNNIVHSYVVYGYRNHKVYLRNWCKNGLRFTCTPCNVYVSLNFVRSSLVFLKLILDQKMLTKNGNLGPKSNFRSNV